MKKIKINKKGFSLIELLATILLISLVLGGGITIVANTIKKSEEKSQILALNNIKKTANTYIEEYANDIAWIKEKNNNSYSCVSIDSLINKGYISNKDISSKYQDKIPKSRYIIVTRDQDKNIISQEFDNEGKCNNNIQKIKIPTTKDYCNTIYYNGNEQTLIKPYDNTYFSIEQITGTDAGNYKTTVKLNNSDKNKKVYVWNDDTTSDKSFTCTIKKQTPTLVLSSNGENGTDLSNVTINLKSNVAGTVQIKSSNKTIASASFNSDNNIQKDILKEATIKKYATSKNTIYITFTLTPSESKNYTQATATYTIGNINQKTINIPICKNNNNIYHNFSYQNLIEPNSGYTLINNIQKEIGKYKITAKLNYGYQWNDNSKEDKEIECEIKNSKFLLRYNDNGGSGCGNQTKDIYYKQAYGSLCTPSQTGYSFKGWYENQQGTGNQITSSTIVNQSSDKTLYAKWQINTYTLNYDSKEGSTCDSKKINYMDPYGTLCTPTRSGYTFEGWYDSNNQKVSETTKITQDTTIYANWNIITGTYTAYFNYKVNNENNKNLKNLEGNGNKPASLSCTYYGTSGCNITLPTISFPRTNHSNKSLGDLFNYSWDGHAGGTTVTISGNTTFSLKMTANNTYVNNETKLYTYDDNIWVRNGDVLTQKYSDSKLYGYIAKNTHVKWNGNWYISTNSQNKKYIWLRGGGRYGCICSSNGTFARGENACATATHTNAHPKCGVATYCASSLSHNTCNQQWISQNGAGYIAANALGW